MLVKISNKQYLNYNFIQANVLLGQCHLTQLLIFYSSSGE